VCVYYCSTYYKAVREGVGGESFAMESCAIGQLALEDFLLGDSLVGEDYTWIPVLQKSCQVRAPARCPVQESVGVQLHIIT
jgi:hypothetical protein